MPIISHPCVIHRHQTAPGAQDRGRQTCIQSSCRMMHCKSNRDSEPVANKSDSKNYIPLSHPIQLWITEIFRSPRGEGDEGASGVG